MELVRQANASLVENARFEFPERSRSGCSEAVAREFAERGSLLPVDVEFASLLL